MRHFFSWVWSILQTIITIRTPFVIPIDLSYKKLTLEEYQYHISDICQYFDKFVPEVYDCDDFAVIMKAEFAKLKCNGVGLAVGFCGGILHVWNIVQTSDKGIWQLEPQTREIFKHKWEYIPIIVIL